MRSWNDDPFTKKARNENFLARSVYKLEEIDRRERVLSGVRRVIDLGAAPGSWTQYCLAKLPRENVQVWAIDLSPIQLSDPRLTVIEKPIEEVDFPALLGNSKVELVLSDMAPKTSGQHDRDTALSHELACLALEVAKKYLTPKGAFVVKLFMGSDFEAFNKTMKSTFQSVRLLRPESTRKHSREIFFVGKQPR